MSPAPVLPAATLERRLRRRRALSFLVLLFEKLWPVLWPPLGTIGLFVCLALLDVPRKLPPAGHAALLTAFALAVLVLLGKGFRGVRWPDEAAVDRRLERASGLSHRPLATLVDRPIAGDAMGAALWRVHLARAAGQISRLRVGVPHPGLARRDRHALRGGLIVALAASIGIAGTDAPDRLWAALHPRLPQGTPAPATELQAWITPPAYTRVAPIFLKPGMEDSAPLAVPAGSKLVVSVTGGSGEPALDLAGRHTPFHTLEAGSFQAERVLDAGGSLLVRRGGETLARWTVNVVPDLPPKAAWNAPPGPARARLHTAFPWEASDDYGVTALSVEIRLRGRPEAKPVIVPIPVPGDSKESHGVAEPDLSAHPWAGLPVTAQLVARDAIHQQGRSDIASLTLPERSFRNPEARALIAIRKGLSLHPDRRDDALAGLDELLVRPRSIGSDLGAYVNLSGIYYLLEFDRVPSAVDQAQTRLWELALRLEEGAAARTERRLQAAMRAAREALAAMRAHPDQAHRNALEQKLQELQRAIQEHMRALAEQYRKQGLPPSALPQDARKLSERDLQRMAEKALQAARQGNTAEAEREMAQLEQMLDALRQARPMTAEDARRQAERRKGRQQLSAMQDLLNREGGLLDRSQSRERENTADGTKQAQAEAGQAKDAHVQRALRRALGEVMQQLADMTGKVPGSLGEADQAMQGAANALAEGKDASAGEAELKAIQALQKGGQEAAQQLANKFGSGQNGQQGADGSEGAGPAFLTQGDGQEEGGFGGDQEGSFGQRDGMMRGRDPLGRQTGPEGGGYDESDDVNVPDHAGPKRTEQIEEELRRRDADRARPQEERQYIERLLRQF